MLDLNVGVKKNDYTVKQCDALFSIGKKKRVAKDYSFSFELLGM